MKNMRKYFASAVLAAVFATVAANLPAENVHSNPVIHRIEIRKFKFVPERLTIAPGDKVVWINLDIVPHTVTAADDRWDSENLPANAEWEFQVQSDKLGNYFCRYHPAMTGVIEVIQP